MPTTHNFTPTEWSSVEDKEKFFCQFVKFLEGGFEKKDFPHWFYIQLSMCFGMIAHYDLYGFWETYFTKPESKLAFIEDCLNYPCYGSPRFTYCDVEKALIEWLRPHMLIHALRYEIKQKREEEFEERRRREQEKEEQAAIEYGKWLEARKQAANIFSDELIHED